jgi:uncharacterized protein
MKNAIFFIIGIIFIAGSVYFFLQNPAPEHLQPKLKDSARNTLVELVLTVGNTEVLAEVADTPAKRLRGLSGRDELSEGKAMFFIFNEAGNHGIWMKDMKFPIDIAWLDEEGTIITIAREVSPDSYPTVFYPSGAAKFVLEVPAGFFSTYSVDTGDIVSLR